MGLQVGMSALELTGKYFLALSLDLRDKPRLGALQVRASSLKATYLDALRAAAMTAVEAQAPGLHAASCCSPSHKRWLCSWPSWSSPPSPLT